MIELLLWIVFGGIVGWIASILMDTNQEQGGLSNIVIGIVGAVIGGFIARALGIGAVSGFNLTSFVIALGGAVLLIGLIRMFTRRSA